MRNSVSRMRSLRVTGMLALTLLAGCMTPARQSHVAMTHIAVQEQLDGKAVDWLDVSDEQYQRRQ